MSSSPSWARGEKPSLEEHAQANLAGDVAATRLHLGGTGRLPVDQEAARFELTEEQRHNRGTRPRTRRWKSLTKIDEEIDRLTARQMEEARRLTDAEQAVTAAPQADAQALADWIAAGEKGARPPSAIYECERDRDAARLLVAAVAVELDRALERRLAHIERHRPKMLADCQSAVDDAHKQLLAKVGELPELRQALLDARETMLWASHFPDPVEAFGFPTAVALGMRKPVETTLGTAARIEYQGILDVLTADADTLSRSFSREQQARGLGEPAAKTPLVEAMWDSDPENVEWKKSELERARRLGEYSDDLNRIATEASDFRP